jgi:hypothetical protein
MTLYKDRKGLHDTNNIHNPRALNTREKLIRYIADYPKKVYRYSFEGMNTHSKVLHQNQDRIQPDQSNQFIDVTAFRNKPMCRRRNNCVKNVSKSGKNDEPAPEPKYDPTKNLRIRLF